MNELNYATLEASKRLHDTGIVLKTKAWWNWNGREYVLSPAGTLLPGFPAPSMAEAFWELPEYVTKNEVTYYRTLQSRQCYHFASYRDDDGNALEGSIFRNTNPTDALISLLVWLTEQTKEKEKGQ